MAGLRSKGQGAAAETVLRDWEDFVTFYHYPKEHWVHLRTSNPIESIFSGVRLRTNAAGVYAPGRMPFTWCSSWWSGSAGTGGR